VPGDGDRVHIGAVIRDSIDAVLSRLESITGVDREEVVPTKGIGRHAIGNVIYDVGEHVLRWVKELFGGAEHEVHREVVRLLATELHRLESDVDRMVADAFGGVGRALRTARDLAWKFWVQDHLGDDELRFAFTCLDLLGTMVSGVIEDNLLGDGFQKVNGEEFRAWLLRNGALKFSVDNSPVVRGLYDLTFAFEGGDPTKPNLAAGQSIEALVRIGCLYKGSVTYKMMAGMGDTIFGPMYEVLLKRGVEFKMFSWVSKLTAAADDDAIETIEVISQVDPTADYPYLVDVAGLPCWPSEPSWDHITDGHKLREEGVDLEQTANPLNRKPTVLHRGTDFDQVVLGISMGGLKPVCAGLGGERNPRFQAMLDNLATVGTRAVQVWSGSTTGDLGWTPAASSIASSYAEPLDTYCDMSHLIPREAFPAGEVKSIGYFCGPLKDGADHDADLTKVKQQAIDFFSSDAGALWPRAVNRDGFDWDVLVDDGRGVGAARFDSQYWRANTQGTERYVTTPAGTVQYRLRPDDSGYSNMVLAGDWTRNGIDGGAVEAALASGRMASRALCGSPSYVPGEHGPLVDAQGVAEPPTYVDFGGLDTFPGPYDCRKTTLYSFVVMADIEALQRLVDVVLTRPTMGAAEFRPLAPMVMLSIGDIANVVPLTPPYNTYGSVNEAQVAVWVPVVRVKGSGTEKKAVAFWMFTSYIWVDNPMSMATGREMYGWPKSMGKIHLPDKQGDQSLSLQTYGLDFAPRNQPAYMDLLRLQPTASPIGNARSGNTVGAFARAVVDAVKTEHNLDITAGTGVVIDLGDDAVDMALPEIYLKQIRSIECGTDAALQQLCDSHATIESVSFHQLPSSYALTIQQVQSHPLATDLGIADQEVKVGFAIEMNFCQDVGRVLWDAFDPTVVF
ncbi:MAG TPA: acetoacetate decarboxylase family protein, partial [Ilumatobacteraceae bacterium]|nr:acetoacetate decarboxylase family protein [Ilumatobacteraceae bacterium]